MAFRHCQAPLKLPKKKTKKLLEMISEFQLVLAALAEQRRAACVTRKGGLN